MYSTFLSTHNVLRYNNYMHDQLQNDLITNFGYMYVHGKVYWPKSFSVRQKTAMTIAVPSVVARINTDLLGVLYHKPSTLFAFNPNTREYTTQIGHGLFSRIDYNPGDSICSFIGEYINGVAEVERREEAGFGAYTIGIGNNKYLDCYNFRHVCMASYANDPRRCWNSVTNNRAKANALCVSNYGATKNVRLKAIRHIQANTEILWVYGDEYWK